MKKALFFAGLAAASLLFVGCNKEADLAGNGAKPFQVTLGFDETRTATTDGIHVDCIPTVQAIPIRFPIPRTVLSAEP